jgi:hypothetical protein
MQAWFDWFSLQQHSTPATPQQHTVTWQKPPLGWYKCNVDAGFHREVTKTTAGWCTRDYLGRFITADTCWKEGHLSIVEGEALLEAMKAMEQHGATQVIFETNAKSVVDAIHNIHGGISELSSIICNIKRIYCCIQTLW